MKKILILLIVVNALPIFSKSPLKINGTDHQIILWAFNHQFDQAVKLADEKIAESPNIPKYYFLKIVTESLRHLAESGQYNFETRFEYRKKKNEELINYTEKIVERLEDIEMTTENKFYLANLYGYLGRMHGLAGSFTAAFGSAKEGKNMLEELVEEYPDLYDAYLLLGMFEYYADRLGGVTEFFASILGFSGDRTTGLEYLKLAQLKGELTKPLAEFILGETYFSQEDNPFDASGYFQLLVKKYPQNKDFYDWNVRIFLELDDLTAAKNLIDNDKRNQVNGYTKGVYLFQSGEYEESISLLNKLIEAKDFKWGGAYRYSKVLRAVASLLIDKPIDISNDDFDEGSLELYNEIVDNLKPAKEVYNFSTGIGRLGSGVEMEIPRISNLPEKGYLRAMYEFYNGVYYYKFRDATKAVLFFTKVAKDRKHFQKDAIEYLIHIYKSYKATPQQLDQLEDIIDDLDDEDLEFSFMDLRK